MKFKNGFLSIDLLVGIAIVITVMGISIPSLAYLVEHLQLKKEAHKLSASLEKITSKASQLKTDYTLHLDVQSYEITEKISPKNLVKFYELPKRLRFNFAPQTSELHFYQHGVCSPGSFAITNGDRKCSFVLSLRCRITSQCDS